MADAAIPPPEACPGAATTPPQAVSEPTERELHGDVRRDEWAWLRQRDDPRVLDHLRAENEHTEAMTAHTAGLRDRIYEEIVARVQETDTTVPAPDGPFAYYSRTERGGQYRLLCRRGRAESSAEEVILDQNALAAGRDYWHVGDVEVSPDHRYLAYSVDLDGSELMTVHIRDLETGEDLAGVVERAYYTLAWASDSRTLFGTRPDQAMRPYQVWRYRLGDPTGGEQIVFEEADERFFGEVGRTRSGALIVLSLESKATSEAWILDSSEPGSEFRLVAGRRHGVEYHIDHHGDRLLIVTNLEAVNFRLMEAPLDEPRWEHWRELIGHDPDVKLDGVDPFAGHLALWERAGGLRRLRVGRFGVDGGIEELAEVAQPEEVCTVSEGENREWHADVVRFHYTSMTTPNSTVEIDLGTGERRVLKVDPVLGGYDPAAYITERVWAISADGGRVPVSVVRRADIALDGRAPALLYSYGAYGVCMEPGFRVTRLPLLDRGGVFAIAHVRGGGEMGRPWYDQGKLAHKHNTFSDFVAAAEALIAAGYTSADRLAWRGASAGGLTMGASVNLRPDLAAAVVAQVPFVDVVSTMLDESLPLTVTEWEEWGNPNLAEEYAWLRAYSPYENVAAADHPAILALGGLNDPRVGYWEPAKWVQRLRRLGIGDRPILLRTELGAGHSGPSGRYEGWREEAFILAFIIDRLPGWREVGEAVNPPSPSEYAADANLRLPPAPRPLGLSQEHDR